MRRHDPGPRQARPPSPGRGANLERLTLMSYQQTFRAALERTARFGLPAPAVPFTERRFLDAAGEQALAGIAQDVLGGRAPREVADRCVGVHRGALARVGEALGCTPVLTIGHVVVGEQSYFERDEDAYRKNLTGLTAEGHGYLHCWLTLPSLEIVDFTLGTGLAYFELASDKNFGCVFYGLADDLATHDQLTFHPMLVGEGYEDRLRANFAIQML